MICSVMCGSGLLVNFREKMKDPNSLRTAKGGIFEKVNYYLDKRKAGWFNIKGEGERLGFRIVKKSKADCFPRKVTKGGSWRSFKSSTTKVKYRSWAYSTAESNYTGFRLIGGMKR